MPRLFLLASILYGLVFIGLLLRIGEVLVLAMPIIVYIGAAIYYAPEKLNIKVVRTFSETRIAQGNPVHIGLTLTNQGNRLENIIIEDIRPWNLSGVEGHSSVTTTLDRGESAAIDYTMHADRGYYAFPGVNVWASDHLGLIVKKTEIETEGRVMIIPRPAKLKRVTIRPRRTKIFSGTIPARVGGQGIDFFGVREYQNGDSPRRINWNVSARHQEALYTNEFELERVTDVGLILDARQRSYVMFKQESLFEHAVMATAALSESLLDAGNRVGLSIYGNLLDWTFPGYGKMQKERILNALTKARLGSHLVFEKLDHLPTRLFPVNSQMIFMSPLQKEDTSTLRHIRARGYQVLVVSPNPISFETDNEPDHQVYKTAARIAGIERRLMLNKLQQTGIRVLDWHVSVPFYQASHSYFSRQSYRGL